MRLFEQHCILYSHTVPCLVCCRRQLQKFRDDIGNKDASSILLSRIYSILLDTTPHVLMALVATIKLVDVSDNKLVCTNNNGRGVDCLSV